MFGDMQAKQEELRQKLGEMRLTAEAGGIKVIANANREIVNITINPEVIKEGDAEEIEDLLLVAVNRAIGMAAQKEAEESQRLIQEMLPPGMGGLSGMFS